MTENPTTDGGRDGDSSAQSRRFTYDFGQNEPPSHAVVRAVAALTNTSALDLEPLYDVIDPSHLDEFFEETDGGAANTELSFAFEGFDVTVTDDEVRVRERDDD